MSPEEHVLFTYSQTVALCHEKRAEILLKAKERGARNRADGIVLSRFDPIISGLEKELSAFQEPIKEALRNPELPFDGVGPAEEITAAAIELYAAKAPWWESLPLSEGADVSDLADLHHFLERRFGLSAQSLRAVAGISEDAFEAIEWGDLAPPAEYWGCLDEACQIAGEYGVDPCGRAYVLMMKSIAKKHKGAVPHGPI